LPLFLQSSPLSSFEISAGILSPDGASYAFDGTLNFNKPKNFRFEVVNIDGSWKINLISPAEGEAAYPRLPEQVVQSFLTASQESPAKMLVFLSQNLKNNLPSSGPLGLLELDGALEGSMIQSASVNQNPPAASLRVMIRAGGKELLMTFSLIQENDRWVIDKVETVK